MAVAASTRSQPRSKLVVSGALRGLGDGRKRHDQIVHWHRRLDDAVAAVDPAVQHRTAVIVRRPWRPRCRVRDGSARRPGEASPRLREGPSGSVLGARDEGGAPSRGQDAAARANRRETLSPMRPRGITASAACSMATLSTRSASSASASADVTAGPRRATRIVLESPGGRQQRGRGVGDRRGVMVHFRSVVRHRASVHRCRAAVERHDDPGVSDGRNKRGLHGRRARRGRW